MDRDGACEQVLQPGDETSGLPRISLFREGALPGPPVLCPLPGRFSSCLASAAADGRLDASLAKCFPEVAAKQALMPEPCLSSARELARPASSGKASSVASGGQGSSEASLS